MGVSVAPGSPVWLGEIVAVGVGVAVWVTVPVPLEPLPVEPPFVVVEPPPPECVPPPVLVPPVGTATVKLRSRRTALPA